MKLYRLGGVIKPAKKIVLMIDGQQVLNPTEDMILSNGWEEYVYTAVEPTEEEKLVNEKNNAVQQITDYDKSPAVNQFYIGDTPMWLDKETRTGLMLRFQAEQAVGNTDTTLWANGVQYPLPLALAVQMLYALEVYASACYDNTQRHLAAVDSLSTIEEIQSYDYTVGYPANLRF